jgi:hypothetical protein
MGAQWCLPFTLDISQSGKERDEKGGGCSSSLIRYQQSERSEALKLRVYEGHIKWCRT